MKCSIMLSRVSLLVLLAHSDSGLSLRARDHRAASQRVEIQASKAVEGSLRARSAKAQSIRLVKLDRAVRGKPQTQNSGGNPEPPEEAEEGGLEFFKKYEPILENTQVSKEPSISACQDRCKTHSPNCKHFSWFWTNGECHLHGADAERINTEHADVVEYVTSGQPDAALATCNCYECGNPNPREYGRAVCAPMRSTCDPISGAHDYSCYTDATTPCNCSTHKPLPLEDNSCVAYGGIPHWDKKTCCAAECGFHCGSEDCAAGPGGGAKCCKDNIPDDSFCSSSNQAPCKLTIAKEQYTFSGCWEDTARHMEVVKEDGANGVEECLHFCSTDPRAKSSLFFGLTEGKTCWCATAFEGREVDKKLCNVPCFNDGQASINKEGNFKYGTANNATEEMCGGHGRSTIYELFDCSKATPPSAIKMMYSAWKGEACGDGAPLKIGKKAQMQGTLDECKKTCWNADTGKQCHGFTYRNSSGTCTFSMDVTAGNPEKSEDAVCYFKKV